MARGGTRAGAGRKRGAPNKATQERQRAIASSGSALDVIIKRMRYHERKADLALKSNDDREAERHLKEAEEAAKAAAPYVHARFSSVEMSGGLTLSHEERLAQLM